MDSPLDILAHAGDAVCAVNDAKCVVYWNAAAEELLGITADEAKGQPCWKLINGKTGDGQPFCGPECEIQAKLEAGEPIPHFDLWVTNKRNAAVLANFSTITIPRQNGRRQPDQVAVIHLIRAVKRHKLSQYDLRINLLGPLEVWRADGKPVGGKFWRRSKVRSLFVFLVLKQGKPVTRDELLAALWPKLDSSSALSKLNTAVYNLRRSLEPELQQGDESHYIFHEDGCYWLGGSHPHWIDVDAFRLGIRQARLETAVDQAISHYQAAVSLYRGAYLIDLTTALDSGIKDKQDSLRQLYLDALEELGNLYQQQEQIDLARDVYLKILALDPGRESACQQLTRLSRGADSLMDNIAYCQRLAAVLKDELDLILSQDLVESRKRHKDGS